MSEEYLVRNCAPTLAGIKTGNLFLVPYDDRETLLKEVRQYNQRLAPKGLLMVPMRFSEKNMLLYVFRPQALRVDCSRPAVSSMLRVRGYDPEKTGSMVSSLKKKLEEREDFPHEIGLFLGYPPEDVEGFIANKGNDYKCIGCWKVYGDEQKARQLFSRYRLCKERFLERIASGCSLENLVNAVL